MKFEAEGREFAKILRSLEQFILTVKDQTNSRNILLFLTCSWRFLISKVRKIHFSLLLHFPKAYTYQEVLGLCIIIIILRHWYLTGCLRKCKNVGPFAIFAKINHKFYRSVNFEMSFWCHPLKSKKSLIKYYLNH